MADEDSGLVVMESTIPGAGNGLFTMTKIGPRVNIGQYTGSLLSDDELSDSMYIVQVGKNKYIDARYSDCWVKFANCCRPSDKFKYGLAGNNARLVVDRRRNTVYIRSTKTINPGSEIFCAYGCGYKFP